MNRIKLNWPATRFFSLHISAMKSANRNLSTYFFKLKPLDCFFGWFSLDYIHSFFFYCSFVRSFTKCGFTKSDDLVSRLTESVCKLTGDDDSRRLLGYCGFRIILFLNGVTVYNDFFKWLQGIFPTFFLIVYLFGASYYQWWKKSKANDDDEAETAT